MSQSPNTSEEAPAEEKQESREDFFLRWKALLIEQEQNTNRRIRLLSQLWQRNRKLGKKIDQSVLNAYLIELIQSVTKDARDFYEQTYFIVEGLEAVIEGLEDTASKVTAPEQIKKELAEHLTGKIGPLVESKLAAFRKRVDEESQKNYEGYVA